MERKVEENVSENQFSFRKNRGTREAILCLRIVIEKSIRVNTTLYLAFVDLEKAFENVELKYELDEVLQRYNLRKNKI
jgi:hypothetical protein